MEGDIICGCINIIECGNKLYIFCGGFNIRIAGNYLHSECLCGFGDKSAYCSETNNSECFSVYFASCECALSLFNRFGNAELVSGKFACPYIAAY